VDNFAVCTKQLFKPGGQLQFNGVTEICHRLALVAMVTKIWDSTSNDTLTLLHTCGLDSRIDE